MAKVRYGLFASLAIVCSASAWAADLVAVVEDATSGPQNFEPFDLLEEGRTVHLGPNETLVLGYFRTCIRETLTGAEFIVGPERSQVISGSSKVEEVDCDGSMLAVPKSNTNEAAAVVFRKGAQKGALPRPDRIIFGTKPLFRLPPDLASINIRRVDEDEPPISLAAKEQVVDAETAGIELTPSGLYQVTVEGANAFILEVSPLAEPQASIISRLVIIAAERSE